MKIDLNSIDKESFNVREKDGRVLINPTKAKHVWTEEELKFRSLLTDLEGNVLSSGFEKFRNAGEDKEVDAAFRLALSRKAVRFTEKMDGSLIILDWIDGKPHLRTRGSFDLGTFEAPVRSLINSKYPNLLPWFSTDIFLGDIARRYRSILFEYVAPTNRIVIRYEEPKLVLIGMANKETLEPLLDRTTLFVMAEQMGVPLVESHELPFDMESLGPVVRGWQDKEGVVAEFVDFNPETFRATPRRLKLKASQYVKLHALKFKLEGNVGKLLFLLGAKSETDAKEKLFDLGVDWEAADFVLKEITDYVLRYIDVETNWILFNTWTGKYVEQAAGNKALRKPFVEFVRHIIAEHEFPESFFGAAMNLVDGKPDQAWQQVAARELLGESPNVVRNWLSNPQVAVNEVLNVPVMED